jgi:uncharacterized protein YdiU (UPF0061 family)
MSSVCQAVDVDPQEHDRFGFDNSFARELPVDPERENFRRQVQRACGSRVEPTPVANPVLLAWAPDVARLVGLPEDPAAARELADVFGGNRLLPGMEPYAACYGGHQFGHWAGQLGDGRAITLGEVMKDGQRWELQLKGAGPTPYSRSADGRAVLRSSIREFLCSEAMHHLGVPTTRALCLVGTGETVMRDMFYDGNPKAEPGAIVCRVAPSFVRFGNFEIFTARDDVDTLRKLADWTIRHHFAELAEPSVGAYERWFAEVCRRTAEMVAHWQRVGFVHGVMNTDNMSVLGLTIDYGPYGWLDDYDPDWTPNTTDAGMRRYRFGQQPQIAGWNLLRFGMALHPLVRSKEPFEAGLAVYGETLQARMLETFAAKLGLEAVRADDDPEDPRSAAWLVRELLAVLRSVPTDMTIFYRALAEVPVGDDMDDEALLRPLLPAYYEEVPRARTLEWLRRYVARVRGEGMALEARRARMHRVNPKYVPRNYLAQLAIDRAEAGDPSGVEELLDVMRDPYAEQPGRERFAEKRPEWARDRPGCSMLSCSS